MKYFTFLIIALFSFVNMVNAKVIVILNNKGEYNEEFGKIQSYLQEMGIDEVEKIVEEQDGPVSIDRIKDASLVIVDDMGYYAYPDQLEPQTISAINSFYNMGKPVYLIGDDLACNIQNTQLLSGLLHLTSCSSNGYSTDVVITDRDNPLINGNYGIVSNFEYFHDIDISSTLNTGEKVVATTSNGNPAILFYEDKARVVVQLPNVYMSNRIISDDNGLIELKKIFQNSVAWLLGNSSCDDRYDEGYNDGFEAGKEYCINNPSACGIDTGGEEECPVCQCSPSQDGCEASFNMFTNTLHVPCLEMGKSYWLDLELINSEPVQLELKGFGEN